MDSTEIISIFNAEFSDSLKTILDRSTGDPVYLPSSENEPLNKILFAHGFYASALHEISHWCVAGDYRRKLVDFGYWYKPDGRNSEEQKEFEIYEAKPQALEWIFSSAVGLKFQVSFDNLKAEPCDVEAFKRRVFNEAKCFMIERGLPKRARSLLDRLLDRYSSHAHFAEYWPRVFSSNLLPD